MRIRWRLARSLDSMAERLQSREGELNLEIERSRQVLTAMSEGVLLLDPGGRLLRSNPAAARLLGADLEGREGEAIVHVARAFPAMALAAEARQQKGAITEALDLPEGRTIAVEVIPLSSGAPEDTQMLFVLRDETERMNTERIRRDFVSNVSHELKTPLAGLSLLADTLTVAVRDDPEQAANFAQRLQAEIRRLTSLVGDLLTLSRLEEPQPAPGSGTAAVDLSELVRETLAELAPLAEAKHQLMTVEAVGAIMVTGDRSGLSTLVRNLLDNAVRYTQPGGHITVRVSPEKQSDGPDAAVIEVQDNGPGIPVADQERIFERFYRVDKARSRETGGTGLGLSIVKHIAERHSGTVGVRSVVGEGSTFTVTLPLA